MLVSRVPCVSVTGTLKTVPIIIIDSLVNISPLHLHIKKEAARAACNLIKNDLLSMWEPSKFNGLSKICIASDCQSNTTSIGYLRWSYMIEINGRMAHLLIFMAVHYTGTFRQEGSADIGVCGPLFNYLKALETIVSIFQTKVHAIGTCARRCLKRSDMSHGNIIIMSDNQVALSALSSFNVDCRL